MTTILSTAEAAARLGVSVRMVQKLIHTGRLKAKQLGREWAIDPADLAAVAERGKGGWPKGKPRKARR
jgi:excisionase family DNA binding protein